MTVRFFMLQTHYRSTLDISNEALLASAKGYKKLVNGLRISRKLVYQDDGAGVQDKTQLQVQQLCDNCYHAMNDDFNTAQCMAHLFNLLKKINSIYTQNLAPSALGEETFERMVGTYRVFVEEVLGLLEETPDDLEGMLSIILKSYRQAKAAKEYQKVDEIREQLKSSGIVLKDMKNGVDWAYEE